MVESWLKIRQQCEQSFLFSERNSTGNLYIQMVQQYVMVIPQVDQIKHENNVTFSFQQQCTTPHLSLAVQDTLTASTVYALASEKPSLIPIDLFNGKLLKILSQGNQSGIYNIKGNTFTAAVAPVTPDMIQCTWFEVNYWLNVYRATNKNIFQRYEKKRVELMDLTN